MDWRIARHRAGGHRGRDRARARARPRERCCAPPSPVCCEGRPSDENLVSPDRYRPEGTRRARAPATRVQGLSGGRHRASWRSAASIWTSCPRSSWPSSVRAAPGKSTILNLRRRARPSIGRRSWRSKDETWDCWARTSSPKYRAERVGFVWQGTARNLVPYLSVRDNIRLPATVRRTQVARKHDVDGLLELVGLTDRAKHKPGHALRRRTAARGDRRALSNTPRSCWPTNRRPSWTRSPRLVCSRPSARSTASST